MLLSKKYIFETRETRFKRHVANGCILVGIFIFLYVVLCAHLVYFSFVQNEITLKTFQKSSPDLVVVFTGDTGRISHGLTLIKKDNTTKLFISGVYNNSTIKDILDRIPEHDFNEEITKRIEVDYQAKNTIENVISTFYYLRKNTKLKKVLIISSDYHLSRINLILNKLSNTQEKYEFFLYGMDTDYKQLRSLKIIYREGIKWLKTLFFMLLWETEGQLAQGFNDLNENIGP